LRPIKVFFFLPEVPFSSDRAFVPPAGQRADVLPFLHPFDLQVPFSPTSTILVGLRNRKRGATLFAPIENPPFPPLKQIICRTNFPPLPFFLWFFLAETREGPPSTNRGQQKDLFFPRDECGADTAPPPLPCIPRSSAWLRQRGLPSFPFSAQQQRFSRPLVPLRGFQPPRSGARGLPR